MLHDCTVQEKEQPPIKVTLQLSHKGLKIVQNVPGKRAHETYRVNLSTFKRPDVSGDINGLCLAMSRQDCRNLACNVLLSGAI